MRRRSAGRSEAGVTSSGCAQGGSAKAAAAAGPDVLSVHTPRSGDVDATTHPLLDNVVGCPR
jgi:hypothetical protein